MLCEFRALVAPSRTDICPVLFCKKALKLLRINGSPTPPQPATLTSRSCSLLSSLSPSPPPPFSPLPVAAASAAPALLLRSHHTALGQDGRHMASATRGHTRSGGA